MGTSTKTLRVSPHRYLSVNALENHGTIMTKSENQYPLAL
jgi:hypothetical protein